MYKPSSDFSARSLALIDQTLGQLLLPLCPVFYFSLLFLFSLPLLSFWEPPRPALRPLHRLHLLLLGLLFCLVHQLLRLGHYQFVHITLHQRMANAHL